MTFRCVKCDEARYDGMGAFFCWADEHLMRCYGARGIPEEVVVGLGEFVVNLPYITVTTTDRD